MTENPLVSVPFSSASAFWFEQHRRYIKPSTAKSYAGALKVLRPFFGETLLRDITIDHIRRYQDDRRKKAGATLLNSELGVVQMILREARLWKNLEDDYRPLPVSRAGAGRSLSKEEEDRLRTVAFSKPKWRLAAHCMTIMLNTTMGFGELRQLRRSDVDLERGCVTVREGAKNEFRHRTIPLNAAARESMEYILKRWAEIGGSSPEHYILPHRPRGRQAPHWRKKIPWILDEPTTAMYSAFRSIRNAAGLPHMRVYDCRVQAITKLLSHPEVSAQVSKEIAGHISQAMQNRYSKQQFETKRAALVALENPSSPPPNQPGPSAPAPGGVSKSADPIQPDIQAEIDRLKGQEHSPASVPPNPTPNSTARTAGSPLGTCSITSFRFHPMEREREEVYVEAPKEQSRPRLVVFPRKKTARA
jgi:integrase